MSFLEQFKTGQSNPESLAGRPQVWKVGSRFYVAYIIPGTKTPLVWNATAEELANAYDTVQDGTPSMPTIDRTLSDAEFSKLAPWSGGRITEIRLTAEDPWTQFYTDYRESADLRPWLEDPDMLATIATAYLEGRTPSADELSKTDWWKTHSEDERQWMETSVTLGQHEITRRSQDMERQVAASLRESGVANPLPDVIKVIAQRRLSGQWSEAYTMEQIKLIADPFAPGELNPRLSDVMKNQGGTKFSVPTQFRDGSTERRIADLFHAKGVPISYHADGTSETPVERIQRLARDIDQGKRTWADLTKSIDRLAVNPALGSTRDRVKGIFADFGVAIATQDETEESRLDRIAAEIEGGRSWGNLIDSVRRIGVTENPQTDVTRKGEDRVRELALEWLGPALGSFDERQIQKWAGRLRNDPDAELELVEMLRKQRLVMFPKYENENLTYEDIVSPVRNMATNIWGRPMQDETMLVDLANLGDYSEIQKRLRQSGLNQGVKKVVDDALGAVRATPMGDAVVRSAI